MTPGRIALVGCIVLAVCAGLGPVSAGAAERKWTEYKYRDDRFAISAPAPPKVEFRHTDTPAGRDERHAYVYYPGPDDTIFVVQVASKVPKDRRSDDQLLKYAWRDIPPDAIREIKAGDVKGVAFIYNTDAAHKTLIHAFARDGLTYIVQVIVPTKAYPHPLQERWMNSFRLLAPNDKP